MEFHYLRNACRLQLQSSRYFVSILQDPQNVPAGRGETQPRQLAMLDFPKGLPPLSPLLLFLFF
jgi:hypothetical protein